MHNPLWFLPNNTKSGSGRQWQIIFSWFPINSPPPWRFSVHHLMLILLRVFSQYHEVMNQELGVEMYMCVLTLVFDECFILAQWGNTFNWFNFSVTWIYPQEWKPYIFQINGLEIDPQLFDFWLFPVYSIASTFWFKKFQILMKLLTILTCMSQHGVGDEKLKLPLWIPLIAAKINKWTKGVCMLLWISVSWCLFKYNVEFSSFPYVLQEIACYYLDSGWSCYRLLCIQPEQYSLGASWFEVHCNRYWFSLLIAWFINI